MKQMKQSEAVFAAVTSVMGKQEGAFTPSKEQRAQIQAILVQGFVEGTIAYKDGAPTEEMAKKYVPGLLNNWLRKDKRLNGGVQYTAKNPGSRTGSGDPAVREMRKLLKFVTDEQDREAIQAALDARLAEIKPAKSVEIDTSVLPSNIVALLSK